MLSDILLRGLPAPVRLFALVGFVFVLLVFGSAVVSAATQKLAPHREVPVDSLRTAVSLRPPGVERYRAVPQRRPVAVDPHRLARGLHPARPLPPAPAPAPSGFVAPAPAVAVAPPPVTESHPTPPGSHELPPLTHHVPGELEPLPDEEPPLEPPAEEPPVEEPPVEPPVEEPPVEEPPVEEPPVEEPPAAEPPLSEAGFENGLVGWNISGVGEVVPTVVTDLVREGTHSSRVVLTGTENRSELVYGGNGTASTAGAVEFHEGDEYWYGFSFYVNQMLWGRPGAHNLIMQFKSDGQGSPAFGLDLWDVNGNRGLWSEGSAMGGGNRFLAPLAEDVWYDVAIHFRASSQGEGFYEVFLNGTLVDARQNVSMIVPGHTEAYIKNGLYRNGDEIPGTSELRLDSAKLGDSLGSVSP